MDFSGKTIIIGITGGIAAYKACDLVRELYRRQAAKVLCIMTPAAEGFITPLTLQALSREPVLNSELGVAEDGTPWHIALAQQGDALLILPATADTIAKLANGFADNMVTTTALAFTGKPLLIAPAMNTRMWQNPLTRANVDKLRTLSNVSVIDPTSGHLACGETGEGHLAEQEEILRALYRAIHPQTGVYSGIRAVVTSGGTEERIDPVRVLSNRSSGKMGLALADELSAMGADVTLVTTRPPGPRPYTIMAVQTAGEMQQALDARFDKTDLLLMAAAVSDFAVENQSDEKIKREKLPTKASSSNSSNGSGLDSGKSVEAGNTTGGLSLNLVSNPDILATLGERKRPGQTLIGFAAESSDLIANATDKMRRKHLDAIVANDISRTEIGIGADDNEVTLLIPDQPPVTLPRAPKSDIARQLLALIHERLLSRSSVAQ